MITNNRTTYISLLQNEHKIPFNHTLLKIAKLILVWCPSAFHHSFDPDTPATAGIPFNQQLCYFLLIAWDQPSQAEFLFKKKQ